MSLLTSAFGTPTQVPDIAENRTQNSRPNYPPDAIVDSIEPECNTLIPLASPTSPLQETDTPNKPSASKDNTRTQRTTRSEPVQMREPVSTLKWRYISPRRTNPVVRPTSATPRRALTPSSETISEPPNPPTLDRTAASFDRHEWHGQTTYTSLSPKLRELDPIYGNDSRILDFTDERPMAPHNQTDVEVIPTQGDTEIPAVARQRGR